MSVIIENYLNCLTNFVLVKIDRDIDENSAKDIVKNELSRYIRNYGPNSFHNYYFQTLNNEQNFFATADFFRQFKSQYSLQGIDNGFLNNLENKKAEMLNLIKQDELSNLYFNHFAKAKIRHKDRFVIKNLGSFFAKFVHTFRPADYCALDNPIKNYFGLKSESFFIAFWAVSKSYKIWAERESFLINNIKREFKELDKDSFFQHDKIFDLKILDLIFWAKANPKRTKSENATEK